MLPVKAISDTFSSLRAKMFQGKWLEVELNSLEEVLRDLGRPQQYAVIPQETHHGHPLGCLVSRT